MPTPEQDLELWRYNCEDCVRTREVGETLLAAVKARKLEAVEAFQQRMFHPVLQAMIRGVRIDPKRRKALDDQLEGEIGERVTYLSFVCGHPLNVNSPKQMQAFFYEDLQQRPVMSKATKASPAHVTLNDDALIQLGQREPLLLPLIKTIQELRTIRVMLSTFVRMPLDIDGRMRCSYNLCGTKTYRLNSSANAFGTGGNLQNVTSGGEREEFDLNLPNCRSMFVPDPGYTFFDTDLSKADLHIVAWEADEGEIKALLKAGRDPYVEAAQEYHHDPSIKKKLPSGDPNPKYVKFKSLCHGTNYLGTASGLAKRIGLLVHEVDKFHRWYFGRFHKLKVWQNEFSKALISRRFVQNKFGQRFDFFDRIDDQAIRDGIAWVPQSTVGRLINGVWLNIHDNLPDVQVLLQTHDSLSGQFPTYLESQLRPLILDQARITIPYEDPLVIPIGLKTSLESWGSCE